MDQVYRLWTRVERPTLRLGMMTALLGILLGLLLIVFQASQLVARAQTVTTPLSPARVQSTSSSLSLTVQPSSAPTQASTSPVSGPLACSGGQSHVVVAGETLSLIAWNAGIPWPTLASYNHLAQPNLIQVGQVICIPATGALSMTGTPSSPSPQSAPVAVGRTNAFPYGQCTWWANQRYAQTHGGAYVPWTINSDAWEWTARAYDFGWHVSSQPTAFSIIDLQPNVQGAGNLGHVAVVEQILANGNVIASSMNWGVNPGSVTDFQFAPGPGVTFLSQ